MTCLLDDTGIFVGLVTMPTLHETEFYEKEIKNGIFKKYKTAVADKFSSGKDKHAGKEFNQYFYEPTAYYLLGRFDLAILSLVDDYELGARTFHSFDPMSDSSKKKSYYENFKHKVIMGPTPKFNPEDSTVELARQTFLNKRDPKPLFALCTFKINNVHLIGNGCSHFRYVNKFIMHLYKKFMTNKNIDLIILESYSWHEITLLLFSTSYNNICEFIHLVNQSTFIHLINAFEELKTANDTSLIKALKDSKLKPELKKIKLGDTHLFTDSETAYGFHFRIFEELQKSSYKKSNLLDRVDDNDTIDIITQWFVRPGHLRSAVAILKETGYEDIHISMGKSKLIFHVSSNRQNIADKKNKNCTKQMIRYLLMPFRNKKLDNHLTQIYSIPEIAFEQFRDEKGDDHSYFLNILRRLQFGVRAITKIENKLKTIGTPKILNNKILNIFSNYNDGILDHNLFGYFDELSESMKSIQKTILIGFRGKNNDYDLPKIIKKLNSFCESFISAYQNRFHNSYRMGDITDFNVEFKGGIHQLVTSFNSAYLAISSKVGNESSYAYVSGNPGVNSEEYAIRLNYFHIYQPEIFLSTVTHEAANYILENKNLLGAEIEEAINTVKTIYSQEMNAPDNFLIEYFDKEFLRYQLIDSLALYLTYNRDESLFSYWYWGYFLQLPSSYKGIRTIDEDEFVGFLLRMFSILFINQKDYSEGRLPEFKLRNLKPLWDYWHPVAQKFIDKLFATPEVEPVINRIRKHVKRLYTDSFQNLSVNPDASGAEKIRAIEEGIRKKAKEFQHKIKDKEICLYKEKELDKFQFTQILAYAYLDLIHKDFGKGFSDLPRSNLGSVKRISSKYADILFDPAGGIFTHDPEVRRKYLLYRSVLTMSLWDMGMKEKKGQFIKRLEELYHL